MGVFMLQVLSTREFVLGSNCELLRIFCSRLCVTLIALAVEKSRQWSLLDPGASRMSMQVTCLQGASDYRLHCHYHGVDDQP